MNKDLLQPLSGFRDYSQPTKDWLISVLRGVYASYGYQPLETPSIERQELLLQNYGDEAQKLLYLFKDNGQRDVGLRYDLTVPLARFVSARWQQMPLPYKRYEIGSVWRAERAQHGRLRQFTQADIDVVGTDSRSAEREILSIIADVQRLIGVRFIVHLNDRSLVAKVLDALSINEASRRKLLITLDKKDKVTAQEFGDELAATGITDVQLRAIRGLFLSDDSAQEIERLLDQEALRDLRALEQYGRGLGLDITIEPSMVRGLEYYTATIIECRMESYPSSVGGGGRYDSLVEALIGEQIPAVGFSFGVDRLCDVLDASGTRQVESMFVVRLPETSLEVEDWVRSLRLEGKNVELFLDDTVELGKQIKFADKRGYETILIPFEKEWKRGEVVEKNLQTSEQRILKRSEV